MKRYTCFCRDMDDDRGTMWIETLDARDVDHACQLAEEKCADDWGWEGKDRESVACVGVAEGDVNILYWED